LKGSAASRKPQHFDNALAADPAGFLSPDLAELEEEPVLQVAGQRRRGHGAVHLVALREAGMIESKSQKIFANGTDWRFWNDHDPRC